MALSIRRRQRTRAPWGAAPWLVVALAAAPATADSRDGGPTAGEVGGTGLALIASKALVCELEGRQTIDGAVLLIRDGKIEAIGKSGELEIPGGYEVVDVGRRWIMPGMIDLHSHVGTPNRDFNDMVYQINSGLRASAGVVPNNILLKKPVAAGVTTILFIPGSGTNMGGQGVLLKTPFEEYERALIRDPGSLKIAQGDNPTRWGYGMGRVLMNLHLRHTIRRGIAYAKAWAAFDQDRGPKPQRDINLDIFRHLYEKTTQVSTHTQYYQLVMMSILMLKRDYGFDIYIDHGSFDSYKTSELAQEHSVPAILGPREILFPSPPRYDTDGKAIGTAAGFQSRGHDRIGFNTDAVSMSGVTQEELPLQAAMSARYGFDDANMETVRGLTIIPALSAGIAGRVGSLEPGKDADIVVVTGHPADPRNAVELVFVDGTRVYDAERGGRLW